MNLMEQWPVDMEDAVLGWSRRPSRSPSILWNNEFPGFPLYLNDAKRVLFLCDEREESTLVMHEVEPRGSLDRDLPGLVRVAESMIRRMS